jgi:hypothetical protein
LGDRRAVYFIPLGYSHNTDQRWMHFVEHLLLIWLQTLEVSLLDKPMEGLRGFNIRIPNRGLNVDLPANQRMRYSGTPNTLLAAELYNADDVELRAYSER